MVQASQEFVDPRIRRTRQLLHQALVNLLETKDFDKISVQDIAEAATVNRATFYDHYADKFALLESMVENRFNKLLAQRDVKFDGTCSSALTGIVLAVCVYLDNRLVVQALSDFESGLDGSANAQAERNVGSSDA